MLYYLAHPMPIQPAIITRYRFGSIPYYKALTLLANVAINKNNFYFIRNSYSLHAAH